MQAIFKAFNDQEIACSTPAVKDSGCSGTPEDAPQVAILSGNMKADISWNAVVGTKNYQVFRTEGVKGCGHGKALVSDTAALSYTDTGLMNGREYYYIVIPKGPNESCFGPASACTMAKPRDCSESTTQGQCLSESACIWRDVKQRCINRTAKAPKVTRK